VNVFLISGILPGIALKVFGSAEVDFLVQKIERQNYPGLLETSNNG